MILRERPANVHMFFGNSLTSAQEYCPLPSARISTPAPERPRRQPKRITHRPGDCLEDTVSCGEDGHESGQSADAASGPGDRGAARQRRLYLIASPGPHRGYHNPGAGASGQPARTSLETAIRPTQQRGTEQEQHCSRRIKCSQHSQDYLGRRRRSDSP